MTDTCDCPSIGLIDKQDLIREKQKRKNWAAVNNVEAVRN
jgi:hypothetical protein